MALPTITLLDFRKRPQTFMEPGSGKFVVKSMINTIKFRAGDQLKDDEVENLIDKGWKVNINKPTEADYQN